MILLNSKKINTQKQKSEKISEKSINEQIKEYEEEVNFPGLKCSCGSQQLDFHGVYERNIIKNNVEYKIKIKRVKCKECGKTHALLPVFILPYYQTEVEEIITCVELLEEKGKSTTEVEKEVGISRQKLNQWRKKYKKLEITIRETYGKILKIREFLDEKKRNLVCYRYKAQYLIQMST